jgi:hypothetical protein
MAYRVLVIATLLTTAALLGDVGQIVCFGEDGHVAFERMASEEHLRVAASTGDTIVPVAHASAERMHVDVSLGEAGVKGRAIPPAVPEAAASLAATPARHTAPLAPTAVETEAPPLRALRTTVLRT